jgi:hypothetical protein
MKNIYIIVNDTLKKYYIGSTNQQWITRRLAQHLYNYKKYRARMNGEPSTNNFQYNYCSCYDLLDDDNNIKIELLEKVDDNIRYEKEKYYINNYKLNDYIICNKQYIK